MSFWCNRPQMPALIANAQGYPTAFAARDTFAGVAAVQNAANVVPFGVPGVQIVPFESAFYTPEQTYIAIPYAPAAVGVVTPLTQGGVAAGLSRAVVAGEIAGLAGAAEDAAAEVGAGLVSVGAAQVLPNPGWMDAETLPVAAAAAAATASCGACGTAPFYSALPPQGVEAWWDVLLRSNAGDAAAFVGLGRGCPGGCQLGGQIGSQIGGQLGGAAARPGPYWAAGQFNAYPGSLW
jgi:hypothetical protein